LTEHLTAETADKEITGSVQQVETTKPEIDTKSLLQEQLKSLLLLRLNANTVMSRNPLKTWA
jgi:hypothetical protein